MEWVFEKLTGDHEGHMYVQGYAPAQERTQKALISAQSGNNFPALKILSKYIQTLSKEWGIFGSRNLKASLSS